MPTKTLSAKNENRIEWNQLVDRLPLRDIYLSYEYIKILSDFLNAEGELFYFENELGFGVYPYIKKSINALPFFKQISNKFSENYYDITTAEYGGPMISCKYEKKENIFFQNFMKAFDVHCKKNNIITEFVRLNSMLGNYKFFIENKIEGIVKTKDIVYVDLTKSMDSIFADFKEENRKSIKKAEQNAVKIIIKNDDKSIEKFRELYLKTMEKRNARDEYRFSKEYFLTLFKELGDGVKLFIAEYNYIPIVGSLLLLKGDIAYDYLRGSDDRFQSLRANNLMVYELLKWCKIHNYKFFVMGGGYKENDSIFQFKSSFSSTTAPFYNYIKIHNKETYEEFFNAFKKYAEANKLHADEHYFPIYRGELNGN